MRLYAFLIAGLLLSTAAVGQMADVGVQFCGEVVPQNQPAVTQRWLRTLSRQAAQGSHLTTLKRRASVVFPIIEPILAKHGLPKDFKFLPLLESAVVARAISPKGAGGFWQIMPGTARLLGLLVGGRRDERFELRKSTEAACRYIKSLYKALGSWMLTAAAYNAGPNYVQKILNRNPGKHPLDLPFKGETKAYVYQTMALKELLTRPQAYRDYLTASTLTVLSEGTPSVSEAERLAILSSFENEDMATDSMLVLGSSSTSNDEMLLLTEADDEPDSDITPDADSTLTISMETETAIVPGDALYPTSDRLETRCLTTGPLTEGQLCTFIVTKIGRLNGQPVLAGDLIYAHVDRVIPEIGRVFLRTDRLVSAQTQQSVDLNWRAADLPRQPGAALPAYNQFSPDWRLTWEPVN
jgi:membrane-bound lytic murein transglycosylase D